MINRKSIAAAIAFTLLCALVALWPNRETTAVRYDLAAVDTSNGDELAGSIGTWVDEDGRVVYQISTDASGNLRIEPPQAEQWKIVIKNARTEGSAILFDQYHYTPPANDYKTLTSPSGDHPFSGVRCTVELAPVEGDPDKLRYTMSTPQLSDPIATILRRQETVLGAP